MIPTLSLPLPFAVLPSTFESMRTDLPSQTEARTAALIQPRADSFDDWCQDCADIKHGLEIEPITGIAVQPVCGVMMDGVDPYFEAFWGYFDTGRIQRTAAEVAANSAVRALILYFDSPGGYSRGVDDAHGSLLALREARPDLPVLAYVGGYCCSAAAWVAAGCAERHSARRGTVGGVGTYIVTVDSNRYYAAMGIDIRLWTDGKFKGLGESGVAWSADWYAWVEKAVESCSRRIKGAVATACPAITPDWMQGQPHGAADLLESAQVGPGHFLQSVPSLMGAGGFATLDSFLSATAETLHSL